MNTYLACYEICFIGGNIAGHSFITSPDLTPESVIELEKKLKSEVEKDHPNKELGQIVFRSITKLDPAPSSTEDPNPWLRVDAPLAEECPEFAHARHGTGYALTPRETQIAWAFFRRAKLNP